MDSVEIAISLFAAFIFGVGFVIFFRRKLGENLRAPRDGFFGNLAIKMMTEINRETSEDAVQRLNIRSGETVVELGPGVGWGLRESLRFEPGRLIGVEISEEFRRLLLASDFADKIEVRSEDARDLSACLEEGSVHKLLAVNVVYFLNPLAEYARELFRILHPDGIALFACKFDVIRSADKSIFVNTDLEVIQEVFNAHGLSVRSEAIELGHSKRNYAAVWVTRKIPTAD